MLPNNKVLGNFRTDHSVGDILRRARIEKKFSIQDIELAIRVSAQHITAIEDGRLEALPGRVYALGFIRTYAEYVDLDGDKILELLKQQSGEKLTIKEPDSAPSPQLEDYNLPSVKAFILVFILLCGIIGFRNFYTGSIYLSSGDIYVYIYCFVVVLWDQEKE